MVTESERLHEKSIEYYAGKVINPKTGKFYTVDEVPTSCHETNGGKWKLRATDLRSRIYTTVQIQELVRAINQKFQYDYSRPNLMVASCHKVGRGAYHFHLQVHDNTRERA